MLVGVPADSAAQVPDSVPVPAKAPAPAAEARRPLTAEQIAVARRDSVLDALWPVKGPEPLPGAILPEKRIIAYYGNPLSKRMGVLGEYPTDTMLAMLDAEVRAWEEADPSTPVQPALHLIAVVAQASPGRDGKYRLRMADTLIERVASWAAMRNALVFLDVQVGLSTLQEELPRLASFLVRPNFHLGIDPEFSMKNGGIPGQRIGTFDAEDINYATKFLGDLVTNHKLPPKILVVHRFTKRGVTNYERITLSSEVQIVMHMDGFGTPVLKRSTFRQFIKAEPVQFVGWKQFYKPKNDNPRTTIAEILRLNPKVLYIQYQ
ncbi:MAG: PilZ domain-containing protein [Gemmatimonadales bacterium]|nr:PilZ domain-containing protein [Gemmatimonadales bacterium]